MTSRENYSSTWNYSNSWIEQLKAKQYMQGHNARTKVTKEESHLLPTHTIHIRDRIIQIKQNIMGKDDTVSFHDPFLEYMANVYQPVTYIESDTGTPMPVQNTIHNTTQNHNQTQIQSRANGTFHSSLASTDLTQAKSKREIEDDLIHSMLNYKTKNPIPRNTTHQYHLSHKYHIFRKNARSKVQWKVKMIHYDEFGSEIETRTADRVGKFSLEDLEWIVMRDLGEEASVLANLQKEHNVAREMYDFII